MTLAIMQPYFLPYIGYFQLLNAVDKFVLYDDVNFINRGWVNRNQMLVNGKAHLFTIPLENASQNKLIHEIPISPQQAWRNKFLKTVAQSYQKAPYFTAVYPMLEEILFSESADISELCFVSLTKLATYLGITTEIEKTSRVYQNSHLKGPERILSICHAERADQYINPIGGMELYNRERFRQEGLDLHFLKSNLHSYPQYKNAFVPWLSILDVLMFTSIEQTHTLLLDFELV